MITLTKSDSEIVRGPILYSNEWEFVGKAYPYYVFRKLNLRANDTPELRYLGSARYREVNDDGSFEQLNLLLMKDSVNDYNYSSIRN